MEPFFIEYRDPMFGIIILFTIVFIIAFVNYWWGVFKSKEEKQSIEQFIKRFEITTDEDDYKKLLDEFAVPTESLGLLAHSYTKSGDFEKAIGVYLLALKRVKNRDEKQYILTELGITYFKAGFLRRSCEVFLEALRLFPRNKVALKYLTVTYEKLKEFEHSLEVLDALEEMGADVAAQKAYVKAKSILADKAVNHEAKLTSLRALKESFGLAERMVFEYWLKHQLVLDWEEIATFDTRVILDLLWYLDPHLVRTEALTDPVAKAVFKARGYEVESQECEVFELEVLGKLQGAGYTEAGLSFSYFCDACKQTFPVHFYRCPSCHALGSVNIEPIITKERLEAHLPF
ncbi:MAG: tetratricopeptide repeat protein [Campylobacterales bacterium]|nr:tetratricopeptide repeat protein [Campylobacterales bacterium]